MDFQRSENQNLGQNNCSLFHVLAKLLFTTTETKLDYKKEKEKEYRSC